MNVDECEMLFVNCESPDLVDRRCASRERGDMLLVSDREGASSASLCRVSINHNDTMKMLD